VCKGLVIDKVHHLRHDEFMLPTRCSRASYGIVFNEPYSKRKHANRHTRIGKNLDGQKYAIDRIRWLIQKGEEVHRDEPVCLRLDRIIEVCDNPDTTWVDTIAISNTQRGRLPSSFHEGDAKQAGQITSNLDPELLRSGQGPMRRIFKKNRWGVRVAELWKVNLEVLMFLRPVGLRFEIRFDGATIGNSETISANWVLGRGNSDDWEEEEEEEEEALEDNLAWQKGLFATDDK
jgi:hypothetical protein